MSEGKTLREQARAAVARHLAATPAGGYGEPIDGALEDWCRVYEQADFVRLAMAVAVDVGLPEQTLQSIRDELLRPSSHTGILSGTVVEIALEEHDGYVSGDVCDGTWGELVDDVLAQVSGPVDLLRLCLAALDQAGMSRRGQERVQDLLAEVGP
jgi:hypothetical protein